MTMLFEVVIFALATETLGYDLTILMVGQQQYPDAQTYTPKGLSMN